MCVFLRSMCLKILVEDVFESITCCLDHWLSCMLDCILVYVFLLSKNCFEKLAWHLLDTFSIASYLSSFLSFFLSQSRQHLDTWWIGRESSYLLNSFSTPGGSIEIFLAFCWFVPRQILDSCICRRLLCSTPILPPLDQSRFLCMHFIFLCFAFFFPLCQ